MRKSVALILILLYLTASTGMPVHAHYCMGKIVSWSFGYTSGTDKCTNCSMIQKKGCCDDKQTILKVSEKYKLVATPSVNPAPSIFFAHNFLGNKKLASLSSVKHFFPIASKWRPSSIYKLHCIFLI